MKPLRMICLVFSVMLAAQAPAALGQTSARPDSAQAQKKSTKKVSISGLVGSAGKTLISDRGARVWLVANPEILNGIEGRRVAIKAVLTSAGDALKILSVRLREERTTPKMDDAAFRR